MYLGMYAYTLYRYPQGMVEIMKLESKARAN